MKEKSKSIEPLPDEFDSYEEAAEFWDTHNTIDYLAVSRSVPIKSEFRGRYYEIESEASVAEALRSQAKQQGVLPGSLASDLLRQQLTLMSGTAKAT